MDEKPITAEPAKKARSSRFLLSPDRLVIGLLFVVCLLWLSDRFQWFGFNHHKGWTVLIAVAAVDIVAFLMYLWLASGLLFNRRFQFGIRSLLLFCLACSIAVSWLAVERGRADSQKKAVAEIVEAGGFLRFDHQGFGDVVFDEWQPAGPDWLRSLLGGNFFDEATGVEVGNPKVNDSVLELIKRLPDLDWLSVSATVEPYRSRTRTEITDSGLKHLEKLSRLKYLFVPGSQITDAGLQHIRGLTQLHSLDLSNTNITDVGLEYLKELNRLQILDLRETKVTDDGVKKLQQALLNCKIDR